MPYHFSVHCLPYYRLPVYRLPVHRLPVYCHNCYLHHVLLQYGGGYLLITWGMETWALNINSKASYRCTCSCRKTDLMNLSFYRLVVNYNMQKVGVTGKTPAKREATTSCCEVQRINLKQYLCFTNNNRLRLWKKFTLLAWWAEGVIKKH